jgi:hypothetical protein
LANFLTPAIRFAIKKLKKIKKKCFLDLNIIKHLKKNTAVDVPRQLLPPPPHRFRWAHVRMFSQVACRPENVRTKNSFES